MTTTTETTATGPGDMIHVAEVGPDTDILIGDSGRFVLRIGGRFAEVDADAVITALIHARSVASLVTRSAIPISGMSAQAEAVLAKFGCARVSRTEGSDERDALVIAALDEAAADRDERAADARRHDRIEEQREHNERAAEYRAERDRREAGR